MKYELEEILQSLNLAPTSQKIYLELLKNGETTARLLSERLMITRPSTYDHLNHLKKRGLVVEKEIANKSYFAVDNVQNVSSILEDSIIELTTKKAAFLTLLPELLKQTQSQSPTIKFFEGKLGLTHLLNDILHEGSKEVYTMWPYEEMLKVLGKEVLVRFNDRRCQEKICIHALWPDSKITSHDYIWHNQDDLTDKRLTNKGVTWNMGYSIYGDRVSFISSHSEVFGFIVSSKDFAALMKVQFDALWNQSAPKN